WKMNGLRASLSEATTLIEMLDGAAPDDRDILICPPATILAQLSDLLAGVSIFTGGQDCHAKESGAHTGDVSAEMLRDAGAAFVIVGHSERRADHRESDAEVESKATAASKAGVAPIICVGETKEQREAGEAEAVVGAQLSGSIPDDPKHIVIAYEPVWAIGTGLTPTLDDIAAMHKFIRSRIGSAPRILYGGSVKPGNAKEILAIDDVNGALVGGASLKAEDFIGIIRAA
ncbi:MAG: triose-phosphate isomerase, partial [Pseudomonadota bacterium]